jgi:hypothetical protein
VLEKFGMSKLLDGTCAELSEKSLVILTVMLNVVEQWLTGESLGAWAKKLPYHFVIHHMVHTD